MTAMNEATRAAIKAAHAFLSSDAELSLRPYISQVQVDGVYVTRGEVAKLLEMQLNAVQPAPMPNRLDHLEARIAALESRTMPMARLGGRTGI